MLFASGHGPDAIRNYTWEQIGLMAECISMVEGERMDFLVRTIAAATGAKVTDKGGPVTRTGPTSRKTSIDWDDPEMVARARKRDAKLFALAARTPLITVVL